MMKSGCDELVSHALWGHWILHQTCSCLNCSQHFASCIFRSWRFTSRLTSCKFCASAISGHLFGEILAGWNSSEFAYSFAVRSTVDPDIRLLTWHFPGIGSRWRRLHEVQSVLSQGIWHALRQFGGTIPDAKPLWRWWWTQSGHLAVLAQLTACRRLRPSPLEILSVCMQSHTHNTTYHKTKFQHQEVDGW